MAPALVISVDAMGGDLGPAVAIAGAALSLERHPGLRFLLNGDPTVLGPLLARQPTLAAASEVRPAEGVVAMDAKPSHALRYGRETSMGRAIAAVAAGEAEVAVSAGNTGALMALSMLALGRLEGVERPAIAAIWPTLRGESVVLDVGANVECDAGQLVSFALMGAAYARCVLGIERPSVGLLNIGTEEVKGHDELKAAAALLKAGSFPFAFHGFVEGNDIGAGTVDVVVTDGFTGNIALKTAEGTAKLVAGYLSRAIRRSLWARIGAVFAAGAFRALKEKLDPRSANGGVLLGLKGIVVKSHGGTDIMGFAAALDMAHDMAAGHLARRIADDVAQKSVGGGPVLLHSASGAQAS